MRYIKIRDIQAINSQVCEQLYSKMRQISSQLAYNNRLLPKCNDRNKKPKRPFSLRKLTNFTRKLANLGTFLKLKML